MIFHWENLLSGQIAPQHITVILADFTVIVKGNPVKISKYFYFSFRTKKKPKVFGPQWVEIAAEAGVSISFLQPVFSRT